MLTQTYSGTLVVKTCGTCGVSYGLDAAHNEGLERSGETWFCPNGHRWHVAQTEETKLRAQLARAEGEASHARYAAKLAENRRRAQKGITTKLKNRIAKGVCPCCKRHFVNVQRHIENQHPDFAATEQSGKDE